MKHILILTFFCLTANIYSQISGKVVDKDSNQPLPGVNVYWAGTTDGVSTDDHGQFQLPAPEELPAQLIISYIGY
ncbi:MAG: carboxypeptidase-like regulatory domain-containing protein, partial [Bacteroidota bacterium]